jgi:hypothetical protein
LSEASQQRSFKSVNPSQGIKKGTPFMTEAEIVRMLRKYYEGLFPKTCPNCGRCFETLREYILVSQRLWPSLNYDIELGNYRTLKPLGGLAMANCVCGSTLALSSRRIPLKQTHLCMEWIKSEIARRGLSAEQVLDHLRDLVRNQVLAETQQSPP